MSGSPTRDLGREDAARDEGGKTPSPSASSTFVKSPDTITSSNANISEINSTTAFGVTNNASERAFGASRFREDPMEKNQRPFVQEFPGQRPPLQELKPNRFMVAATDLWLYEILAWTLSAVLLISIWVLLRKFDDKPLSAWTHSINLNSAVSALATVMKGMLLVPVAACIGQEKFLHYKSRGKNLIDLQVYDTASRGVEGSIQIMFATRARAAAYIGALITLAAIVLEPFVQQVVSIETRQTVVQTTLDQQATVPRSQVYDNTGDSSHSGINLPDDMLAAIYTGLFTPATSEEPFNVVPSCPRGNCTYPPFQSLAVCSKCVDVIDLATKSCSDNEGGEGLLGKSSTCDWSLPNGLELNISTANLGFTRIGEGFVTSGTRDPMELTDIGPTLVHFSHLSCLSPAECPKVVNATECALYWCVNTYSANMTNGLFSESTISSWTNSSVKFDNSVPVSDKSQALVMNPPPIEDESNNAATHSSTKDEYVASWAANKFIINFLTERLSTGFKIAAGGEHEATENGADMVNMMLRVLHAGTLPQVFANIAASMTRTIRQLEPVESIPGTGPAIGTASENEVYIHVRWRWLALPAGLLLFTLLLLILTIGATRRNGLMAWKCSPLALMFHGLDPGERQVVRGVTHLSDMRRHSRRMPVRLDNYGDAGGWGFDRVW